MLKWFVPDSGQTERLCCKAPVAESKNTNVVLETSRMMGFLRCPVMTDAADRCEQIISLLTLSSCLPVSPSLLQPTPVILLKEGTDTSQGIPQLISNINACQVRTITHLFVVLCLFFICSEFN